MDIIEQTRKLGVALQQDERYINYAKAKLANDSDKDLQDLIGKFNLIRMQIDTELQNENRDEEKVKKLNEELRDVYGNIMSSKAMVEYNNAKTALDSLLNEINTLISQFIEGDDPMTCEIHHECTGSCSTCGGCH